MSITSPFSEVDYVRVMFGCNAVQVPAVFIVQRMGEGIVLFVGASKSPVTPHPLHFGSSTPHQHVRGELIVRPHWIGEGDRSGSGAAALLTGSGFGDPSQWRTILDMGI